MRPTHARTIARTSCRAAILSAAVAFLVLPARADDPAYVGTWASDLAQCKNPQDKQGAPVVITKDRYDQHETHCTFTSVEGTEPDFKVKADCTIEGSAQPMEFTLTASGDTLTVTDDSGPRDLLKCP
jgi:hypothetical protein